VTTRRNIGFDVFNVRLLIGLDKLLRAKRRYQGDFSASINDALLAVNLNTVKLVILQGRKKQTARETQVVLLGRLIRKIKKIADARGCSINQLVNSGLMAYYSKQRTGKPRSPSRRARRQPRRHLTK
jgi:ribose 1,5-bisphosphokinase PhnN